MVSGSGGAWKIVRNNRLYGPNGRFLPPIFSHEFVIQNQADISACVAFFLLIASLIKATETWALKFVSLSYSVKVNGSDIGVLKSSYTWGPSDIFAILFYSLMWVLFQVLLQENTVDVSTNITIYWVFRKYRSYSRRVHRNLNLSRTKQYKLNDSAQFAAFCFISILWSLGIIVRESYVFNISSLWEDCPQLLSFGGKFFYIIQLGYWLHCIYEFYLLQLRKDEMWKQFKVILPYLLYIGLAYIFCFTRLTTVLLFLHYSSEGSFHAARVLHYCDVPTLSSILFVVWKICFILARLGTITLSVLTFWYGLSLTSVDKIDLKSKQFNTQTIRVLCLAAVFLLQAFIMWSFIMFHLRRARQRAAELHEALRNTTDLAAVAAAEAAGLQRQLSSSSRVQQLTGSSSQQRQAQQRAGKKKMGNKGGEGRNSSVDSTRSTGNNGSASVRQRKQNT